MPSRELLSEAQRTRLSTIPEMEERELVRYHTLSESDLAAISIRRGATNRLGFAVQMCLLRYPGRPLRRGEVVPRPIVEFAASQVGADPNALADYAGDPEGAGRDTTRREHAVEIVRALGLRPFDASAYRELSRWLLPVADGTDSGEVLVGGAPGGDAPPRDRGAGPLDRRAPGVGDEAQGAESGVWQASRGLGRGATRKARCLTDSARR